MAKKDKVAELMAKLKGHEIMKSIPVHWWVGTVEERTKLANTLNEWAKQNGINERFPIPIPGKIE